MPDKPVVVDTNIIFSALLKGRSQFAQIILGTERPFFICESTIVELFQHKERIVKLSQLSEEDIARLFYLLLRHLNVAKEELIQPEFRKQAFQLCKDIDEADSPQIALTLHLDGLLWTGDKKLKNGLRQQGFQLFFEPDN